MREARISAQQFAFLVGAFNLFASLLILPAPMTKLAGTDAWLAGPTGILIGALPVCILLGLLARRHPDMGFGQLAEFCLGKWPGRLAILLLGATSLFITSLIIRNVMDFAAIALLPATPTRVLAILFTLVVCYAAYAGSEVITRLSVLVMLLTFFTLPLTVMGTLPELQTTRILPFLHNGIMPVLKGAWPSTGWFAEMLVLAPFAFQVSRPAKSLRAMVLGNLLAAVHLTVLIALSILVFGITLTPKFSYPVYAMARQVAIGQFLERLELGLITVWLSGMLVKAAATLWAGTRCVTWTLGLSRAKWLVILTGAAATWLTQIWHSEIEQAWFSTVFWSTYTLPFFIGLPALMLLGSFWRMRRRKGVPS